MASPQFSPETKNGVPDKAAAARAPNKPGINKALTNSAHP
jgi:hypothetical protein